MWGYTELTYIKYDKSQPYSMKISSRFYGSYFNRFETIKYLKNFRTHYSVSTQYTLPIIFPTFSFSIRFSQSSYKINYRVFPTIFFL